MKTLLKNKKQGEEVWKGIEITGHKPCTYFVSTYGNIKNRNKLMKQATSKKGYKKICLVNNDSTRKSYSVNRLVALAFIPNPNNYPQINHIDGDKTNNNISNLEWCTNSQNQKHAIINCLKPKESVELLGEITKKSIDMYDLNMKYLATFDSARIADRVTGIPYKSISLVLRGKSKNASGYIFKYHEDKNEQFQ